MVFISPLLPIILVRTADADAFYDRNLVPDKAGKMIVAPTGDEKRLRQDWPKLKGKEVEVEGVGDRECAADVVLSSTGE